MLVMTKAPTVLKEWREESSRPGGYRFGTGGFGV